MLVVLFIRVHILLREMLVIFCLLLYVKKCMFERNISCYFAHFVGRTNVEEKSDVSK